MTGNILFQNQQHQSQGPYRGMSYGIGSPPTTGSDQLQFYSSNYDSSQSGYRNSLQGNRMSGRSTPLAGYSEQYGMEGKMGWLAAFGTAGYPDEPPLLEELGINFGHIKSKTLTVLNPLKSMDQHIMDDTDLAGPILFCLLFATFLLLSGKSHFGYVYGFILLGTVSLHFILTLMSQTSINFIRTASVLGYCLLPLVLTSAIGVLLSLDGVIGYSLAIIAISWCTYSASAIFVAVLQLMEMRALVAYPVGLFYSAFAVMTVFSELRS